MLYNADHMQDDNLQQAAAYLRTLAPGRLPYEIFLEAARLTVMAAIEMVPLKVDEAGDVHVLLTQRPAGDTWEHMWHIPGTIMQPTDRVEHGNDYRDAIERVIGVNGEFGGGVRVAGEPVQVETERRKTTRGDELAVVFYIPVEGETTVGQFFALKDFPGNVPEAGIMPHHVDFVRRAAERYLADTSK